MVFDRRALEALDFPSIRSRVVARTATERGRTMAESLAPYDDFTIVALEQRRTAAMREVVDANGMSIGRAVDTAEITRDAAQGVMLAPRRLRETSEAIDAAARACRSVRESEVLREVAAPYAALDSLQRALADAVDERDFVRDSASAELARIRKSAARAHAETRDRANAMARSSKYSRVLQEPVVTVRDGRFVVPVRAEFARELPGIVHDTSASGQTLFVEPLPLLEANNRLRALQLEEQREIERILAELSRRVGESAAAIEANVSVLALLDVLVAKARVGDEMDATAPGLNDAALLDIDGGRHPLLGERAVAQSVRLDEDVRLLVVSGPNMGGKTVALKMAGLLVAMAYAGMQIPANAGSRVGRFSHVLVDIGDEQSIAENASTFSAHLDRMRQALEIADDRTLLLVDEIGGGTEPSAGAALAIAILERILAKRARAIVTTHATELKLFAHDAHGAVNASVRFDPKSFEPTHHLDIGAPGQSLAFPLAIARGLDASLVARAEELLGSRERDYERALADVARRAAEVRVEREALERERREAEVALHDVDQLKARLNTQHERFLEQAQERLHRALRDFVQTLQERAPERRARVTPSQSAALAQTLEAMRRDLAIREHPASDKGSPRVIPSPSKDPRVIPSLSREAPQELPTRGSIELDVRGQRYADAEPIVDRWIDDALMSGASPLRLIHGKGTGALGKGLQEFLRDHPAVASVRYGNEEEGSHGVTIIELR